MTEREPWWVPPVSMVIVIGVVLGVSFGGAFLLQKVVDRIVVEACKRNDCTNSER